jgi:excisionase family DNA binding protein
MDQRERDRIPSHQSADRPIDRRYIERVPLPGVPGPSHRVVPAERLLGPEEVADYLGLPVKTLYQWRYKGVGPPGLRIGRHVRYRPEDVEAWLDRASDPRQRGDVA